MKTARVVALNFLTTFLIADLSGFVFFRDKVRQIYREYWSKPVSFGRGYPRYHFEKHKFRGFDIAKNSPVALSHQPFEIKPYPVWGNAIGCFDQDIDSQQSYEIYLAGDSVTWGYAPLNKKFGSLLEKILDKNVAACGVSHTGQIHQFSKFTEIATQLQYHPKVVIVNVVNNDTVNDYLHPQATVVDGYQFNVANHSSSNPDIIERTSEYAVRLKLKAEIAKNASSRLGKLDPRKYSATTVILWHILGGINLLLVDVCDSYVMQICSNTKVVKRSTESYPITSPKAARNRKAIADWIKHSHEHSYRLIFADVNTQISSDEYQLNEGTVKLQDFCIYVESLNGECYSFIKYLVGRGVTDWREVRWKRDGHFNIRGNEIYAQFLESVYNSEPR